MVPFLDLKKQHLSLKEEIDDKIKNIIYKNSRFILGEELAKFENEFANFCGKKYGVGVASGTDALKLSLLALNIGRGDEVILPVNTAIPCPMAIKDTGAEPCFIDVNENYLIDISKIEEKITEKTKAIMPVHLYGRSCEMNRILEIAEKYNLKIIEDCCQSHGAEYKGKKVPISEIGCFSFYPSKNLGALGDAGMIVTNSEKLKDKLFLLRNYGQKDRYNADILGVNSRLDEIQAVILRIKLNYLNDFNEKRMENANLYNSLLGGLEKIIIPNKDSENSKQVYHLYVIRVENKDDKNRGKDRNGLMDYLKDKQIGTLIHYPAPLHLQKAFSYLKYKKGDFPNAEKFSKEILSLPMYPELKDIEIEEVCKEIGNYFFEN